MKFKSKETKYLQFGRETIKIEKGKVYDIEKDFDKKFIQPITYIVKMNSKQFKIVNDYKKTKQVKEPNEVISSPLVEEPSEPTPEPVQEPTQEPEVEEETQNVEVIKKSDLDQMTKQELLELQEKYNLEVTSSNLKQEIYEQVENYLLEQDLLVD